DVAAHEHDVPVPDPGWCELDSLRTAADPGRVDEHAVTLAAVDHLGVAGHDPYTRGVGGSAHGERDAPQVLHGKALFQDEGGGEQQRPGTAHGQVVDGAVHRGRADVAAGEEGRIDDVGVRGEGDASGRQREHRAVVQPGQLGVAVGGQEDAIHELTRELAAASV